VQTAIPPAPPGAQDARPDPKQLAMVDAALAGVPEGELRSALAALGRAISTPQQPRR
jgi:hypothetical protein